MSMIPSFALGHACSPQRKRLMLMEDSGQGSGPSQCRPKEVDGEPRRKREGDGKPRRKREDDGRPRWNREDDGNRGGIEMTTGDRGGIEMTTPRREREDDGNNGNDGTTERRDRLNGEKRETNGEQPRSTGKKETDGDSITAVHCKVRDLVTNKLYNQALKFYKQELHPSQNNNLHGNTIIILPSIIKACSFIENQHMGFQLHCVAIKSGSDSDIVISNSFITMYSKFSQFELACKLFDQMPQRDSISWNSIVNCCMQNGFLDKALGFVKEMLMNGFVPKPELVAGVLSLCGREGDFRTGRAIHGLVIVDGRIDDSSLFLSTALVDLYFKFRDLVMAFRVFCRMHVRNEVSWTAMIAGCNDNQSFELGIDCFRAMMSEGVNPNRVTLLSVLPACGVKHGREVHGYAIRKGFDSDHHLAAALIHKYSEFSEKLQYAIAIFERSTNKDVVLWSSIIKCFSQKGNVDEAMKLLSRMRAENVKPNSVTLLAIISACASQTFLNRGYAMHGFTFKSGLNTDTIISNALIDMYAKCGCLADSHKVFREMPDKELVSWSSLINGYGFHGYGEDALQIFHEMQESGMELDGVAYLAILSACNHAGLVQEGLNIFSDMMKVDKNHKISTPEHYACVIDLLGRSGRVDEACEVLSSMPMKPSARILRSLVFACKIHGRMDLGKPFARKLIELEPENVANYALLSTAYAETGNWVRVEETWKDMKVRGLNKSCGSSSILVKNEVSLDR
ncbi:hypothetical protein ACFE04_009664 [Oxalis oulophora]